MGERAPGCDSGTWDRWLEGSASVQGGKGGACRVPICLDLVPSWLREARAEAFPEWKRCAPGLARPWPVTADSLPSALCCLPFHTLSSLRLYLSSQHGRQRLVCLLVSISPPTPAPQSVSPARQGLCDSLWHFQFLQQRRPTCKPHM